MASEALILRDFLVSVRGKLYPVRKRDAVSAIETVLATCRSEWKLGPLAVVGFQDVYETLPNEEGLVRVSPSEWMGKGSFPDPILSTTDIMAHVRKRMAL